MDNQLVKVMQPTEQATCAAEQCVDTQLAQTGATAEHRDNQLLYE